ncbi:hypothetical protein C5O27_15370 [Gordonia alkanivorans]|uniref:UvrD-helicase domain-containing protein n=1 Tax=Gordonia alkanivorans TaxID=84096 RepID=UPI000FDD2369|nr:UvrD-helicase domain-containing protein [Gordonia alkanivorans]AZZ82280.1 hypothetical protein C5O27_15370 [Gordonia alkanivorans]
MQASAAELLVELRALWNDWQERPLWYLHTFLPNVEANGARAGRSPVEQDLLRRLRAVLDESDWRNLAELVDRVDQRRVEDLVKHQDEQRARAEELARAQREAEAAERAEFMAAQRAAEQEEAAAHAKVLAEVAKREQQKSSLISSLKAEFSRDFFGAHGWWRLNDKNSLVSSAEYQNLVSDFVTDWCRHHLGTASGDARKYIPNPEQAAVIGAISSHSLVEARAGSGKTATIVARAVFLIKATSVDPSEILMLAFNAAAAAEMRDRLEKLLPGGRIPHVMTFHALAYRLVHPSENLVFDQSDSIRPLSRLVQDVIDEFISVPESQEEVRQIMLAYFRMDWESIAQRGDNLSHSDQVEYRRQHLQSETINGEFVRSYGEKLIANIMAENDLTYFYERDHRWDGFNYKPDFTVCDHDGKTSIVIEYFGLTGEADYDRLSAEKRKYWKGRPEFTFLEYNAYDVKDPSFRTRLLSNLEEAGARPNQLTDDQIWRRIKKRAIGRFTDTVTTMIGRARQRRWDSKDLHANWQEVAVSDPHLNMFIDLGARILDRYEIRLINDRKEDFTGLIWRAVDCIRAGVTQFGSAGVIDGDLRGLRFLVVDEFQDFSMMFYRLLREIVSVTGGAQVTAVGDEWQAINEFAGSTTEYFRSFEDLFTGGQRMKLSINRRSTNDLVRLGNTVMAGQGFEARGFSDNSGEIREFSMDLFSPSALEEDTFGQFDHLTPSLIRLITSHLRYGRSVAVLARVARRRYRVRIDNTDHTFYTIGDLGGFIRERLNVTEPSSLIFSSTHGFKGQESDAVILLDVDGRNYPLIHPTWVLFQVFGDDIETLTAAERRLFYVAVSRPRRYLDVITTRRDRSPFWPDADHQRVQLAGVVTRAPWSCLPDAAAPLKPDYVEIRAYISGAENFEDLRRHLQKTDFRFHQSYTRYWVRFLHKSDFSSDLLHRSRLGKYPGVRLEAWHQGQLLATHSQPSHNW